MKKLIEILIVDDNPADVDMTRRALSQNKISNNVSSVNDGVEAMAYLRQEGNYKGSPRPSVILLDLNMPRKNGHEVLAELKQDSDLCRIPVVILTTSREEEDIAQSYLQQASCYIAKPVDLNQFFKVVEAVEHFWVEIVELPNVK